MAKVGQSAAAPALEALGTALMNLPAQMNEARNQNINNQLTGLKTILEVEQAKREQESHRLNMTQMQGTMRLNDINTQIAALKLGSFTSESDLQTQKLILELESKKALLKEQLALATQSGMKVGDVTPPKAMGGTDGLGALTGYIDKMNEERKGMNLAPLSFTQGVEELKKIGIAGVNESGVTFNTNAETNVGGRIDVQEVTSINKQLAENTELINGLSADIAEGLYDDDELADANKELTRLRASNAELEQKKASISPDTPPVDDFGVLKGLAAFQGLSPDEQKEITDLWPTLTPEGRKKILAQYGK